VARRLTNEAAVDRSLEEYLNDDAVNRGAKECLHRAAADVITTDTVDDHYSTSSSADMNGVLRALLR
jgi:hypothetical protein